MQNLVIKGARTHNLKNISLTIPKNTLTVITGLSGSGKSTLAFDTIYAEGQRRYVESLSTYARQFLGMMTKPDVDYIEGLSPAISIQQKTTSKSPRSTVGTTTEIYDYLRLLYARCGQIECPECAHKLESLSQETITNIIMAQSGQIFILATIIDDKKGTHKQVLEDLVKEGYTRVRINGKIDRIENFSDLNKNNKHTIQVVIDRININDDERLRVSEAVESSINLAGTVTVYNPDKKLSKHAGEITYSTTGSCPNHPEIVYTQIEPNFFSFNSPKGACQACEGLGEHNEIDPELLIPDKNKSLLDGAITIFSKPQLQYKLTKLSYLMSQMGFDAWTPIKDLDEFQLKTLLYGQGSKWQGIIPMLMADYHNSSYRKSRIEKLMRVMKCSACQGTRLNMKSLAVKINGKNIAQLTNLPINELLEFFNMINLDEVNLKISQPILKEIQSRLSFLDNVGLGYLNLSRSARSLSGGEAQRIRLATQIGSNLSGVLYVLDEPSIGLHQRDNDKLIETLKKLRDIGNTVIVVEHDEDTIHAADHLIEIGPGAGTKGGHIVEQGKKLEKSLTGKYLNGEIQIHYPKIRRTFDETIKIQGARKNNLKNLNIDLPTNVLCCVTGVSGSGKSSLINQTLVPALAKHLGRVTFDSSECDHVEIPLTVKDLVVIDQEPIGRTPRSNPATYSKIFDDIRELYTKTKVSKQRGYKAGRFSFNVKGGRCESCQGDGTIKVEMNFLPDVEVTCDKCRGKRYNKETLEVLFKGKNVHDVLEMDVDESLKFFENFPKITRKLNLLKDVGLGYIKLGQSATTLSGGESQRLKLTKELAKVKTKPTVYVLDEPTTGLHFEDVRKLMIVLNKLVDKNNSLFIIEHNLDVIKCADYIIDLGPEGGKNGGEIIATGTPEEIIKLSTPTSKYLTKKINGTIN